MAVQTTSILSNSHRTQYYEKYLRSAKARRVYDLFAAPRSDDIALLQKGSTYQWNFLSAMDKGTSAISEIYDITPQTLLDATVTLTPTSRADAIQDSELQVLQNYLDYAPARFEVVGEALMETVEDQAIAAAMVGGLVSRAAARASLDAGTAGNRLSESEFDVVASKFLANRAPGFPSIYPNQISDAGNYSWGAIMAPEAFYDLKAGGNVVSIAQYQQGGILLNNELGSVGAFRVIVSPFAKVFGAAGADNATAIATTLGAAANRLATTVTVASGTNIAVGMNITIGTEETSTLTDAGTFYPHNERITVTSISGTTMGVAGSGPNGGLRYSHASGEAVRNADSVFPVLFGGPFSMAKVYAKEIGEFGQVVGPKRQGLVDQFISLGYKWYGGYGILSDTWLHRGEYTSSMDA